MLLGWEVLAYLIGAIGKGMNPPLMTVRLYTIHFQDAMAVRIGFLNASYFKGDLKGGNKACIYYS